MLVITRNSVYKVTENPAVSSAAKFTVEKVEDLYPGGHPNVRVGDRFDCNEIHVRVGRPMELRRVVSHHHKDGWRACGSARAGHYADVTMSDVVDIAEEKR